jgi:hypothetical protein
MKRSTSDRVRSLTNRRPSNGTICRPIRPLVGVQGRRFLGAAAFAHHETLFGGLEIHLAELFDRECLAQAGALLSRVCPFGHFPKQRKRLLTGFLRRDRPMRADRYSPCAPA